MRIGIDARLFGGSVAKGLGRYTEKLLEYLLLLDKENEYVVFVRDDTFRHFPFKASNVKLVRAPWRWYSLGEQIMFPLLLWSQRLDLMHFPHFNVPYAYRGKFVVTIHDLILTHFPTERATTLGPLLYKIKHLGYTFTIRHAVMRSQKIITVSKHSKQDMLDEFHVPQDKIVVTYEAVDAQKEDANVFSEFLRSKYCIQDPYLLAVGNAYPHKNLEILLDLAGEIKKDPASKMKIVLVGKEDYFFRRLKQLAWAKNVDDRVIFPGFVPDAYLPYLYQKALAYIFPSFYEGFGLPGLEAMCYGTPVLSSSSSCLPEIFGNAALYFDSKDVYGIIQTIQALEKKDIRENLVQLGHEQVKKYSWKKMAQTTLRIYESLSEK